MIPFARHDPFENMAIDEALFRIHQKERKSPVLRFYGWKRPAVSLGYFQDVAEEINYGYCRDRGITVVRRPTGGKAVLHAGDLTYSLVAREGSPLFSADVVETYRIISGCIVRGLARAGIKAQIVEEGRRGTTPGDGFCFATSYRHELLAGGKKICGSAQMRARGVFLQHGSVLVDLDPLVVCSAIGKTGDIQKRAREIAAVVTSVRETMGDTVDMDDLCRAVATGFEEVLHVRLAEGTLSPEEDALKEKLLADKYTQDEWNLKGWNDRRGS